MQRWDKKNIYNRLSLKQVFFTIVLFNSLSVLLCSIAGYRIYTASYNQLLFDSMASGLSVTSAQISQSMENIEYISTLILSSSTIQEQLSEIPEADDTIGIAAYNRAINNALFNYTTLFRSNHISYVSLFNDSATNCTNWALLEKTPDFLIDAAVQNGSDHSGAVVWTSGFRQTYLLLSRNVREIDNLSLQSLGNLVIAVDIKDLVASGTQFSSANSNQKFIFATKNNLILYASDEISDAEAVELMQSDINPWKIIDLHGHKYFAIKGTLPNYDFQYLSMVPYDVIAAALNGTLRWTILILAVGLFITTLISNRFIRAITRQFDVLIDRMSAFTQNELELPSIDKKSLEKQPQEIRMLHHGFDEMAVRIQNLVQVNYVNKLLTKDAQLRALRSQISPHFLYNTLETINWRAKAVGNKQISQIVESLGSLLRASLSNQKTLVSLTYELELVDAFITIQKIRFEDQLDFQSSISEDSLTGQIPPLTIQPLVENAIHYGMEEMTDVCHIELIANVIDKILILQVRNEGSSFEDSLLEKLRNKTRLPHGFGIGLLNIDERIRLIYGSEYGLTLTNENGFAVATVRIPLRTEEEVFNILEETHAETIDC